LRWIEGTLTMMRWTLLLGAGLAALGSAACAQTTQLIQPEPGPPQAAASFTQNMVDQGRERFHRTCAQCHGRNMVNSGTTVYDLRRFPVDQPERFFNSVTNGKGNMPSFKDALEPETIQLLWAYVATRGGKEM
jgi:cytochrome c6